MSRPRILITAGPTREMLDPVRFLSNVSTGHMGYDLAREAVSQDCEVYLVSGPTGLKPPRGVSFFSITSADDLKKQCEKLFPKCDALVMVAAVCDFTALRKEPHKIKRIRQKSLHLKRTPDIVAGLAKKRKRQIIIGFCLETEQWLENARSKLSRKKLDGIVANYYAQGHIPFGNRKINTAFLERNGDTKHYRGKSKRQIAKALLAWIEDLSKKKYPIREN